MKRTWLFLLALAACSTPATTRTAQAKGKPDWVDGASAKYPRELYLTGVGLADDRPTAQDRGRGEISKVFTTVVTVNTASEASESSSNAGGKSQNAFSQSVSQGVQTASKKALEDVEIAETWQDEATRQYYALAVLDRAKAMAAIKDKIADFDHDAQQWKTQMEGAAEKLPRVKAAMKLLSILKARADLNSEMRVLDSSGTGIPSPFDESAVKAAAAKAVSELDVVVDIR